MFKTNIKNYLFPALYVVGVALIIGSIVLVVNSINNYLSTPKDYDYVYEGIFEEEDDSLPVMTETKTKIIKPYLSEGVTIGKYFYDFEAEEERQQNSIIFFENTYMQNSGVDYISDNVFDVVSILDGEVIKVEKDTTLGNIIQIKHDNNLISVYQGVDNVKVKEGDKLTQGDIIATSGNSLINTNYKTALHFEIYYKGAILDPENFYTMNIEDFE